MAIIIEWDPCLSDHPSSEFHLNAQGWVARLCLHPSTLPFWSLSFTAWAMSQIDCHIHEHSGSSVYCQEVTLHSQWCLLYMKMLFFFSYKFPLNMDTYFSGALVSFPLSRRRANIPLTPSPKQPLLLLLLVIIANTDWVPTTSRHCSE